MPKTIDSLVNDCNMDTLPSMPVIADYYGLQIAMKITYQ